MTLYEKMGTEMLSPTPGAPESSADFTDVAFESFYNTVDDSNFPDEDAKAIYQTLRLRLRTVPFSQYLKRYIYRRAGLQGSYAKVPDEEYQLIIRDAFREHHTPASFRTVTSKLSALSKNWLTQQTVKRQAVFLLGFGLGMSVEDVNQFLTRALCEREINFKDPFETVCWYCYSNRYNYLKYQQLWQVYEELPPSCENEEILDREPTDAFRFRAGHIRTEEELMAYLSTLKVSRTASRMSVSARRQFDALYDAARDLIAGMYNDSEAERNARVLEGYRERLSRNDRMYEFEKMRHLAQQREKHHTFTREEITPGDVERVICSAIPMDRHGNLVPIKFSAFRDHFGMRKFSRQRLSDILARETEIDRFDLITLNFFLYSQRVDNYPNPKIRYEAFVQSTNQILRGCGMGTLYPANPYECFLLMCILAEDPLGTYADVWEMAYSESPAEDGDGSAVPDTKGEGR